MSLGSDYRLFQTFSTEIDNAWLPGNGIIKL